MSRLHKACKLQGLTPSKAKGQFKKIKIQKVPMRNLLKMT